MNSKYFIKRDFCPGCQTKNSSTIYSNKYNTSPIKDYLRNYYFPERIDLKYVKNEDYKLKECHKCNLIFQHSIPNKSFMKTLYKEWVHSERSIQVLKEKHDVHYYNIFCSRIDMLIRFLNKLPCKLKFFDYRMGWGDWCLMAQAFGCSVTGTELSNTKLNSAKYYNYDY